MFFFVVSNYQKDSGPSDLKQDHQGKFPVCYKNCFLPNRPIKNVCGSDNRTYLNKCDLENAACLNPKMKIVINCYGRCPCQNTKGVQYGYGLYSQQGVQYGYGLHSGSMDSGQNLL